MAPGRFESDFRQQGWIDTLGLKQIFSIFSVYSFKKPLTSRSLYFREGLPLTPFVDVEGHSRSCDTKDYGKVWLGFFFSETKREGKLRSYISCASCIAVKIPGSLTILADCFLMVAWDDRNLYNYRVASNYSDNRWKWPRHLPNRHYKTLSDIYKRDKLRVCSVTSCNWFLLCSLFLSRRAASYISARKVSRVTTSRLQEIVSWQFAFVSIANLCVTAADRYIAIVIPFITTLRSWPLGPTIFSVPSQSKLMYAPHRRLPDLEYPTYIPSHQWRVV